MHSQEEISYLRIEVQLKNPSIQQKILDLDHVIERKYVLTFPMHFGKDRSISFLFPMERTLMNEIFLPKLDPHK